MTKISLTLVFTMVVAVPLHSVLCDDNPWMTVLNEAKNEASKAGLSEDTLFKAQKIIGDGAGKVDESLGASLNDWVQQADAVVNGGGAPSGEPSGAPSGAPSEAPSEAPMDLTPDDEDEDNLAPEMAPISSMGASMAASMAASIETTLLETTTAPTSAPTQPPSASEEEASEAPEAEAPSGSTS